MSAAISLWTIRKGTAEYRVALWDYVARRYAEGASLGLIANETGLGRYQAAYIVRKRGLQGTKRWPSEILKYRRRNAVKNVVAENENRWSDPAERRRVMDAIGKEFWRKTKIAKRNCRLIPVWVPDELETEYRWWAMNDSEEAAAAWAREAKRGLERASA